MRSFLLGMNIANLVGGLVALVAGVILIYQFPLKFVLVTIITTILGMLVGGLFGRLVDYPTSANGICKRTNDGHYGTYGWCCCTTEHGLLTIFRINLDI